MKKVIIFAGNKRQFDNYVRNEPRLPEGCFYVSEPEHIAGMRGVPYLLVGTYWENKAWQEANEQFRLEVGILK